ncbi:hypothetical protein [Komagataeibacter europaeus]|uniref:hypothetical protein n=1 Tax=Komagataeibacter europaeus TaxID=33995 RepID=UPI0012DDCDB4|nr:hypothetical protein [Komagataeibacter europaeus]
MSADQPSRGKVRRQVGSGFGSPFNNARFGGGSTSEWAYLSSRFPNGMLRNSLPQQPAETQQFVADWWFLANFEPFNRAKGGPYFGFDKDSVGFGQAPFAPVPLTASTILNAEFADVVDNAILEGLAARHPGEWMHITSPPVSFQNTPQTEEAIRQDIARRLEVLERQIQSLPMQPEAVDRHGIGGNYPPSPVDTTSPRLLLKAEKAEALAIISKCRSGISNGAQAGTIAALWEKLKPYLAGLGLFVASLLEEALKGAVNQIGSDLIQHLPDLVQMYDNGASISQLMIALVGYG